MTKDRKLYQAEYYRKNKERLDAYKQDYAKNVTRKNKKHFGAYIDKDIMEEFERRILKNGITKADFLRDAIIKYLAKKD